MQPFHHSRLGQHPRKRGGALAASLALVILIAGMGAGLVQVISSTTQRQARGIDRMRAVYLAEAGLSEGFLSLAQGRDGNVGSENELAMFSGGYFWVTAEELTPDLVRLTSNALYGVGRCTLSAVVASNHNPIGSLGLSSLGQIEVGIGSTLNAIDSNVGGPPGEGMNLRANGDIILHSPPAAMAGAMMGETTGPGDDEFPDSTYAGAGSTLVQGDARPGMDGIVIADPGATITGINAPSAEDIVPPPVKVPQGGTSLGNLTLTGPMTVTGKHRADSVVLEAGTDLALVGPLVLVLESLTAAKDASITIDSSAGPVEIYVKGQLDLMSGSTLDNIGADSTQVALLVGAPGRKTDGELPIEEQRMLSSGNFHGLVYAPYSQLKIGGDMDLVGAASGGQLHLGPGATVTYDKALENAGVGIDLVPRLLSWTVEPLDDAPIMQTTGDARTAVLLLGIGSQPSTDVLSTYDATVKYTDTGGFPQVYTGDVRVMDWSVIDDVDGVSWFDPVLTVYKAEVSPKLITDPDAVANPSVGEIIETLVTPL